MVNERFPRALLTMASIRQNAATDRSPDWRNLGIVARVLVAVNVLLLAFAFAAASDFDNGLRLLTRCALVVEPALLISIVALYAFSRWLEQLPYIVASAAVVLLAGAIGAAAQAFVRTVQEGPWAGPAHAAVLAGGVAVVLLAYLRLHAKAFSPALAEARLQALQARIRPHFLFNSLNAVLAHIRQDPKRAERALEDLAELFRTLMSDARQFVRLADEISLLERYAEIEELRLGERLRITWEIDAAPLDALLPPLVLQPLLENAVYHGVEPATGVADVLVRIERRGDRVGARIEHPHAKGEEVRAGNHMALDNIRERLMLFFDAEARMDTKSLAGRYSVEIEMPYRTTERQPA